MRTPIYKAPCKWENDGLINGNRWIRITENFSAVTSLGFVVVPEDFKSDGASIPQFAWSIVGHPFSGYLEAAVVHDYLYAKQSDDLKINRKQADKILRELMWNMGYSAPKVAAFYMAVRMGGWASFKRR